MSSTRETNVKIQIEHVQALMRDNINKTIDRGESLTTLEQKSKELDESALIFKTKSSKLKCQEMIKSYKMLALLLLILGIIILILYFAIKGS